MQLEAHSMLRLNDNYVTYFNNIEFYLTNTSEDYVEYAVEILDKETFEPIPKKGNWKVNSEIDTIKIAPNNRKKLQIKFKPFTEVRKYYVCTKVIGTKDKSDAPNVTRICLRLLLYPTISE